MMSRCLVKQSLIKDSKILLIIGRRLIGRYLLGSDLSPSFLNTDTTMKISNRKENKHLLYNLPRTGESSGEHILRTMTGILSGASGFRCTKIIDCTTNHSGSDLRAKSLFSTRWKIGKLSEPSLRLELHEKFLAKGFALSIEMSGPLGH